MIKNLYRHDSIDVCWTTRTAVCESATVSGDWTLAHQSMTDRYNDDRGLSAAEWKHLVLEA